MKSSKGAGSDGNDGSIGAVTAALGSSFFFSVGRDPANENQHHNNYTNIDNTTDCVQVITKHTE